MDTAPPQAGALPENYSIELSSQTQLRAIPAIELAAATGFSEADLPLGARFRVTDRDVLEDARRGGRLWIASDCDHRVVGFAMLEIIDGLAHLDELDVHPDHAGKGIGSSLLQVAIDWASKAGYSAMTLVTFRHVAWNAPFYRKRGFNELRQDALGSQLSRILHDEAVAGLNVQNRIAMQLELIQLSA